MSAPEAHRGAAPPDDPQQDAPAGGEAVLLYYKYVPLAGREPEVAAWYEALCGRLGQVGRVRVAADGVNATVGGRVGLGGGQPCGGDAVGSKGARLGEGGCRRLGGGCANKRQGATGRVLPVGLNHAHVQPARRHGRTHTLPPPSPAPARDQVGGSAASVAAHIDAVRGHPVLAGRGVDFKVAPSAGPAGGAALVESGFDRLRVAVCKVGGGAPWGRAGGGVLGNGRPRDRHHPRSPHSTTPHRTPPHPTPTHTPPPTL